MFYSELDDAPHKMGASIHTTGPVAHGYPRFHRGGTGSHSDELEALVYIFTLGWVHASRYRVFMSSLRQIALAAQVKSTGIFVSVDVWDVGHTGIYGIPAPSRHNCSHT